MLVLSALVAHNKTIENEYVSKCGLHVGKATPIEHRGHGKRSVHHQRESSSLCIGEVGSETLSGIKTASDEAGIRKAMESGRSGINLVARHLKALEDLLDSKPTPRTEYMIAASVQWATRIMRHIDNVFDK